MKRSAGAVVDCMDGDVQRAIVGIRLGDCKGRLCLWLAAGVPVKGEDMQVTVVMVRSAGFRVRKGALHGGVWSGKFSPYGR